MAPTTRPPTRPWRAVALGAVVIVVGCGTRVGDRFAAGPSSTAALTTGANPTTTGPVPTTIDATAAKAEITANWERFFDHGTPIPDREALLEDGPTYAAALAARAKDPLQAQATATVQSVQLTGPAQAMVSYMVLINGKVALPNAQGTAVLQGVTWKVSAQSFCSLVNLGATGPVPGCS